MPTLTNHQKSFIVIALARFHTPQRVADLVKEEYGIDIPRQQVDYYNPTTASSKGELASRWEELFRETRKQYIEGQKQVAIAHERWRLEKIEKIVRDRMQRKDHGTALKALEQAAKERGRVYSNVQDVQSGGERVETPNIFVYGGDPPEERAEGA